MFKENVLIGMDIRGQNIFYEDFKKNAAVIRRCRKKLTPEGRRADKVLKFYKNFEKVTPEDYKKFRGIEE